jgi:hypothetical protein
MAGKVKAWMWVVVAVIAIGILSIIAIAGIGVYFFSRHIETRSVSAAAATSEFEQVKARFSGQKALIELDDHGRYLRSNTDRPAPRNAKMPDELEVMAFDPDDARIVHIRIPFWLLRMKARGMEGGTIDFNGNRMNLEDLKLTVEDLERLGPALVVDHRSGSGERVLVWSN